jgi:hypothetical protein
MQTLNQMSDTELLAWAHEFRQTPFTTTIGKRLGNPIVINETFGAFPPVAVERIAKHGGQRKFNDDTNGAKGVDDKLKAVNEMVRRFKLGECGRTRGETVDPFMTIVLRIVRRMVKAKNEENAKRIDALDKPDLEYKAILERTREKKPETYDEIMAEATAERQAQERKAAFIAKAAGLADTDDL